LSDSVKFRINIEQDYKAAETYNPNLKDAYKAPLDDAMLGQRSASHISPLQRVVSHSSGAGSSGSTRQNSHTSGFDPHSSRDDVEQLRLRPWRSMTGTLHMDDDPHDFYLGDIYAEIDRPFGPFGPRLKTDTERQ